MFDQQKSNKFTILSKYLLIYICLKLLTYVLSTKSVNSYTSNNCLC